MIRGTTPTITFDLGVSPSSLSACYVTFAQRGRAVLEKSIEDMEMGETSIAVTLTQAETLSLAALRSCEVQVRAKDAEGHALASDVMELDVGRILKDGEI